MQRNVKIHHKTWSTINSLSCDTIIVDASEKQLIWPTNKVSILHAPDAKGFFAIDLLRLLFGEFLKTNADILFLIEGDLVPTKKNVVDAQKISANTKIFYQESNPENPFAYVRREGLAGIILRSEIARIYEWMAKQSRARFRYYEGYCDTFLWNAVSEESTGYSVSTAGPDWIKVMHITHDDVTRVTKKQRINMKVYRARHAAITQLALECNKYKNPNYVEVKI